MRPDLYTRDPQDCTFCSCITLIKVSFFGPFLTSKSSTGVISLSLLSKLTKGSFIFGTVFGRVLDFQRFLSFQPKHAGWESSVRSAGFLLKRPSPSVKLSIDWKLPSTTNVLYQ